VKQKNEKKVVKYLNRFVRWWLG